MLISFCRETCWELLFTAMARFPSRPRQQEHSRAGLLVDQNHLLGEPVDGLHHGPSVRHAAIGPREGVAHVWPTPRDVQQSLVFSCWLWYLEMFVQNKCQWNSPGDFSWFTTQALPTKLLFVDPSWWALNFVVTTFRMGPCKSSRCHGRYEVLSCTTS